MILGDPRDRREDGMAKRITVGALVATLVALVTAVGVFAAPTKPGSSPENPILVSANTSGPPPTYYHFNSRQYDGTTTTCGSAEGDHHAVWFRWVAPFSGTFSASTFLSRYDTVVTVYDSGLNVVTCNDDHNFANECPPGNNLCSFALFSVTVGNTYYISVSVFDDSKPGRGTLVISQ
jgi:hypothetical protein